jgi:mannose-6-phosphate isomerase-like protein (cupin superfamily)
MDSLWGTLIPSGFLLRPIRLPQMDRTSGFCCEEVIALEPGVSLTIPLGTHFQFRSLGAEPLAAIGVTMPPWPGDDEAFEVPGKWEATVTRG